MLIPESRCAPPPPLTVVVNLSVLFCLGWGVTVDGSLALEEEGGGGGGLPDYWDTDEESFVVFKTETLEINVDNPTLNSCCCRS